MLYEERKSTKEAVKNFDIPKGTIAELGGVPRSDVSRYVGDKKVSDRTRGLIEQAVTEIFDLISFMQEHFGLRPDLRELAALREAIEGLKAGRRLSIMENQLADITNQAVESVKQLSAK